MQLIIIIIIIAAAISVWNQFTGPKSGVPSSQPGQQKVQQLSQPQYPPTNISAPTQAPASSVSIDSFIKYGPLEKEIIKETNRVVFEFFAVVSPKETQGQVSFETKIEGFDADWQTTNSKERTVDLTPGARDYTFMVRAKIGNALDPSPAKVNFRLEVSPYFGKLKISGITPPTLYSPSLITLNSQAVSGETIKITGWQIKGQRGTFVLPKGVEKYDSLNPLFKEDIVIRSGDRLYISSNPSPIYDTNFRPNKCLGYLDDGSRQFTIPISKNCPRPRTDRLPRNLSQSCQTYITNRAQCESLNTDKLKSANIYNDSVCMTYIETTFTYPACFRNYSQDNDFFQNEWHIYTNSRPEREILDWKEDTVYLRDQNGLFIDKYSYKISS